MVYNVGLERIGIFNIFLQIVGNARGVFSVDRQVGSFFCWLL